jgi:hypothetical protein
MVGRMNDARVSNCGGGSDNRLNRTERIGLIEDIQRNRGTKLLVYVTGDRQPVASQNGEDAVLPLYKHLLGLSEGEPEKPKIDLFLYSRGGDVSVPWRVVSMIREFCDIYSVLIPYKAHSAATMISLGADYIQMGRKAELGPIDPSLRLAATNGVGGPPAEISVEDVSSYVSFMRDRANISDQAALATVISQLADHLTPLTLGTINRQYSHIRLVARKLLASHASKTEESRIDSIIETLTEKMYSHGHAIGRREAKELGLPVEHANDELEKQIWRLYEAYEELLQLDSPIDPEVAMNNSNSDKVEQAEVPLAVIESVARLDVFEANIVIERQRAIPPNPQININLNLGLPPGFDPAQLTPDAAAMLQNLINEASRHLAPIVQQEIARQSPIAGIAFRLYGGHWKNRTDQPI